MLKKQDENVVYLKDELVSIDLLKKVIDALREDEVDEFVLIARHTIPEGKYTEEQLEEMNWDHESPEHLPGKSKLYLTFFGNRHVSDIQGLLLRMNNVIDRFTNGESIATIYNEVGD